MFRTTLVGTLSLLMVLGPTATAGDPFSFSSFFRQKRPQETAVVQLAKTLDDLEHKLNSHGTVVAKAPDIWGEARLTKHRQEFERQMEAELGNFKFRLNAAIARSDQAFLANAFALSAAADSVSRDGDVPARRTAPTINVDQSASLLPGLQFVPADSDPKQRNQSNTVIVQTDPNGLLRNDFALASNEISIEPQIYLDQKARYLNHLHEIRRINEGDDTADSPGYSLNLVRIPVSIMPGKKTRRGYGAEITVTATPHVTEELLPQTFRQLVVNDLVDLLSPVVRKLAEELPRLNEPLEQQGPQFAELAEFLTGTGSQPYGPLVLDYYGENGSANDESALQKRILWIFSQAEVLKRLAKPGADECTLLESYYLLNKLAERNELTKYSTSDAECKKRLLSPLIEELNEGGRRCENLQDFKQRLLMGHPVCLDDTAGRRASRGIRLASSQESEPVELSELTLLPVEETSATDEQTAAARLQLAEKAKSAVDQILRDVEFFQGNQLAELDQFNRIYSELGQQIYGLTGQLLQTGVGSVTRRAREPVASSQIPLVFGVHELVSLAYDFRQRSAVGQPVHLTDVRSYLHEELEAAYDLATTPTTFENPARAMLTDPRVVMPGSAAPAWQPGLGHPISLNLPELVRNTTYANVRALLKERVRVTNQFSRILRVPTCKKELELHVPSVTTSLAWAVVVESVLLNQKLNEDMQRVSKDPGCGCMYPGEMMFCGANPAPGARQAFVEYVKCRWPIHVFALDPQAQDQNVADSFSMRREMQLAIALAFAQQQISAQNMTRYVRRLEMDMETIALNRTVAAFGHGRDVFGWRFYPRVQSPPFESNATTFFRDFVRGGPNRDALRRSWEIEPGMRECTAVVLMPSFIQHVTFDLRGNYFPLGKTMWHDPADTVTSIEDNMEMSHKIRLMQNATCSIAAEANCYREGEVERLMRRADQLAKKLPLQTVHSRVPNENTLGGFEMFSSGITDLAPELLDFYGVPGVDPRKDTVVFLVGNNFSIHDTKVLAGNRDVYFDLVSRQVMRAVIPAGVQIVDPFKCVPPKRCEQPRHVVDVHVATPYGVSQHLQIPVLDSAAGQPSGYLWARENLTATYLIPLIANDKPELRIFDVKNAKIQMLPPFTLDVAVPPGDFPHPDTAKVALEISSPQLASMVELMDPPITPVTVDAQFVAGTNVYRISPTEFYKAQVGIQNAFIAMLNNAYFNQPKVGGNFEVDVNAVVVPNGSETSFPLDNCLSVHVQVQIP